MSKAAVEITIPAVYMDATQARDIIAGFEDKEVPDKFYVTQLEEDYNQFEGFLAWFGVYWWIAFWLGFWSFVIGVYIVHHMGAVIDFYKTSVKSVRRKSTVWKAQTMAFALRLLILIPELACAVFTVLVCVDPLGVFYIFEYNTARSFFLYRLALAAFTDLVVIFYSTDIYRAFKTSRAGGKFTPFLVDHPVGLVFIIVLGVLILTVTGTIEFLVSTGTYTPGSSIRFMYTVYTMVSYTVVIIVSLVINRMVTKELNKVDVKMEVKGAITLIQNCSHCHFPSLITASHLL